MQKCRMKVRCNQVADASLNVVFEVLLYHLLDVISSAVWRSSMASPTPEKASTKTNSDTDFCISARCAAESVSALHTSNESVSAVGLSDGLLMLKVRKDTSGL